MADMPSKDCAETNSEPETPSSEADMQSDIMLGISEVADMTGISAFTIRYYDKCGFFPGLVRDKRGVRSFSQVDIDQLHLIEALRNSGLSIEGIQYYVKLAKRGEASKAERLLILQARETVLECQRDELEMSLKRMHAAMMELSNQPDD